MWAANISYWPTSWMIWIFAIHSRLNLKIKIVKNWFRKNCKRFWIPSFQVMINIMVTFVLSVMTLYTFYRYHFQQNGFQKNDFFNTFEWLLFYLLSTIIVIFMANLVTKEVITHSSKWIIIFLTINKLNFIHLIEGESNVPDRAWNYELLYGERHYFNGM